ncbi:MAG: helix-turn-helix transcriptional regulator [Treponema sp.]|nr:helix-turn-helix transcriptional regulator [Treponema sp.]MCL2250973.1 helix-turn-helix transcriptional regulator [Treponema sp.]
MFNRISVIIKNFFQTRDELSFRNIRFNLLPVLLVFPFSVIISNLRYYGHSIAIAGFATNELMFFMLGSGWLILSFISKKLIIPLLKISVIISAVLLIFLFFTPMGSLQFALYMAFKFCNGFCTACAFYLFCFVLNNVERLAGMAVIQLYYGFYYLSWNILPDFHMTGTSWTGAAVTFFLLIIIFFYSAGLKTGTIVNTESSGKGSGVVSVIGLGVVHYMIMCMSNYIEWSENSVSGFAFGLGTIISIALVFIIQLLKGKSALYIWLMFLAFTLFGLGILLLDTEAVISSGSFFYGLGDSLGYIIICYMCAGAIKRSKSLRMYRIYCFVFFIQYFIISGIFSFYFNYFDEPNRFLAFVVVLVLVSLCLLFMPVIQKKLFEADWTDGLYLRDMEEYSKPLVETQEINKKEKLNLTPREQEIFTLLLKGTPPKEIAYTLKISYETVHHHQKNLYRKLGIQSIQELFAKYSRVI